jgi:hypothetical protein
MTKDKPKLEFLSRARAEHVWDVQKIVPPEGA